jgi:hypothetical protein
MSRRSNGAMWLVLAAIALLAAWLAMRSDTDTEALAPNAMDASRAARAPAATSPEVAAGSGTFDVRVEAHVVDPSGSQVEGAVVEVWRPAESADASLACRSESPVMVTQAETDSDGIAELMVAEEERYCVHARDTRWASSEPRLFGTGEDFAESLRLALQPFQAVSGRVVEAENKSVPGMAFKFVRRDRPSVTRDNRTTSDSDGRFAFRNLDTGEYSIESLDARYAIDEPKEVVVKSGAAIDDLLVKVHPIGWIKGRVLDERGEPILQVMVIARSPYDPDLVLGQDISDRNGAFAVSSAHRSAEAAMAQRLATSSVDKRGRETPANTSESDVVCLEFQHRRWQGDVLSVAPSKGETDLGAIYLRAATPTAGVLLDRQGRPVAAQLTFRQPSTAHGSSDCARLPIMRHAVAGRDGTFHTQLPNGKYEVEIVARDFTQTLEVSISDTETLTLKLN